MPVRATSSGWLAVAAVLTTLAPRALADSAAVPPIATKLAEPEAGAVQRAKVLFEKGVAAYSGGKYYEAIEIFIETDRLYPNPQIAYNIAKAYDQLGSRSGSLRYYRDYLGRSPEATDRGEIEKRIRELEASLAEEGVQLLSVVSDPPDALVLLDERPVGLTPWTGLTWPGKHKLELRRPDYETDAFVTEVEAHRSSEVKVVLHASEATNAAKAKAKLARPPTSRFDRLTVLTWTALATGGAALGTAVAIEAASDAPDSSIRPSTAFFAGVGVAASITGGILLYYKTNESTGVSEGRGNLALKVTPKSCGARFTAQF